MNIQNIVALSAQLKELGFDEMDSNLLKRICFKPEGFCISTKYKKEKDLVCFDIYLERTKTDGNYILKFYDAFLCKETKITATEINGVSVFGLRQKMQQVNWNAAFNFNEHKNFSAENSSSWQMESTIEAVIDGFEKLEASDEGKVISNSLKMEYWANIPTITQILSSSGGITRPEIRQRFYFLEGEAGISMDEAHRFLQNKWLERQLQLKKREPNETEATTRDNKAAGNNGLLKKIRPGKSRSTKRSNVITN